MTIYSLRYLYAPSALVAGAVLIKLPHDEARTVSFGARIVQIWSRMNVFEGIHHFYPWGNGKQESRYGRCSTVVYPQIIHICHRVGYWRLHYIELVDKFVNCSSGTIHLVIALLLRFFQLVRSDFCLPLI